MVTSSTDTLFTHVDMVELVVRDQQDALDWYTEKLDFEVRRDSQMPEDRRRWVTLGVPGQDDLEIVLEPIEWGPSGTPEEKEAIIGANSFSLQTTDMQNMVETLGERGVEVVHEPESRPWGVYTLIEDLYGNTIHVLEPDSPNGED